MINKNGADMSREQQNELNKVEYSKPKLTVFGDVRDVTLGASFPGDESQAGTPGPTCQLNVDNNCPP